MNARKLSMVVALIVAVVSLPLGAHARKRTRIKTTRTTQVTNSSSKLAVKSYTGTLTVKDKAGNVETYTGGELPELEAGDSVSVAGGSAELDAGNGTITAGDGSALTVNEGGSYGVTAGSVVVYSGGKTQTVSAGQTVQIQTTTETVTQKKTRYREDHQKKARVKSWSTTDTQIIVTNSPKQETTNSGTTGTVSPSAP